MKYKTFILHVCRAILAPAATGDTPTQSTPRSRSRSTPRSTSATRRYQARVTANRTLKKRRLNMTYEGPGGEQRRPLAGRLCPGADLTKQTLQRKNGTGIQPLECSYCKSAWAVRKSKRVTWMCELCRVPLCVTCNSKYHRWVNNE